MQGYFTNHEVIFMLLVSRWTLGRLEHGELQIPQNSERRKTICGCGWNIWCDVGCSLRDPVQNCKQLGGQDHITRNSHLALDNLLRCSQPHFPNISGYCCHKAQEEDSKTRHWLGDSPTGRRALANFKRLQTAFDLSFNSVITKNRFCHLSPPAWLRQTLHSTPWLCRGNMLFGHEHCS